MSDRRQVHRREPITIELDNGQVFKACPLTWLERNDLGALIVQQTLADLNDLVRLYVDPKTTAPQLELRFAEKLMDPMPVFAKMYPTDPPEKFIDLTKEETTELLLAGIEVNGLDKLRHLIDPNSPTPMPSGGNASLVEGIAALQSGQKIGSLLDSSSPGSIEEPSSN